MMKYLRSEQGDTLIEVTFALVILSMVLISSFVLADKTYLVGRSANERNSNIATVQQQFEALQEFRNSHTWDEFWDGGTYAGVHFDGLLYAIRNSHDCNQNPTDPTSHGYQYCFHMAQNMTPGPLYGQWYPVPSGGSSPNAGWTSFFGIYSTYEGATALYDYGFNDSSTYYGRTPRPTTVTFIDYYGADTQGQLGNGVNKGTLWLQLSDLDGLSP